MIEYFSDISILGLPFAAVLSFAIASILIELTPGPNMTYLALVAASHGRRFGFAAVVGVALGLLIIGLAAGLGVTAIVQSSDILYEALRWAGVLYLLYLAFDGWRGEKADEEDDPNKKLSMSTYFRRGLITNLLNPKAAGFYLTVLPTFLPLDVKLSQSILLTMIYVVAATLIHLLIVILAGALEPLLNDPRREQIARRFLSLLLAAVAIWFAFETAR
ncbi:MAG: LysE family translocator [Salaquimonas sp.]